MARGRTVFDRRGKAKPTRLASQTQQTGLTFDRLSGGRQPQNSGLNAPPSEIEQLRNRVLQLEQFIDNLRRNYLIFTEDGNLHLMAENISLSAANAIYLSGMNIYQGAYRNMHISGDSLLTVNAGASQIELDTFSTRIYSSDLKAEIPRSVSFTTPMFTTTNWIKASYVGCDLMKANKVDAKTYTPGAGNIW